MQRLAVGLVAVHDADRVFAKNMGNIGRQEIALRRIVEDGRKSPGAAVRDLIGAGGGADERQAGRGVDLAPGQGGGARVVPQHRQRAAVLHDLLGARARQFRVILIVIHQQGDLVPVDPAGCIHGVDGQLRRCGASPRRPLRWVP